METQATPHDDEMPAEIEFSKGTRGKFFKPGTALNVPVVLDAAAQEASSEAARRVLLDQSFFQVDEEQMRAFEAVLEQPIGNSQAVRRLLEKKSPWEP